MTVCWLEWQAVMGREGGTTLSAQGDHIEALLEVSFKTVSQLLSNVRATRLLGQHVFNHACIAVIAVMTVDCFR
jgi:hypothetical protein